MSTVRTGIPAALASRITGPIAFESHGLRTMAETFLTMKSFTWLLCRPGSLSPLTTMASYPCFFPSAVMLSPMTLKKGLSRVRRETPMVPLVADAGDGESPGVEEEEDSGFLSQA